MNTVSCSLATCALAAVAFSPPLAAQLDALGMSSHVEAVVLAQDTYLEGDLHVASLHVEPGVTVFVAHDLHLRSTGPIVIEGDVVGLDADMRVDGIDRGPDIVLESAASVSIRGSIRSGDGRDGLMRTAVAAMLREQGLEPLLYGSVEIHDDLVHFAVREAWTRGQLDAPDLAGSAGGSVFIRAPLTWVNGPVVGGDGGRGGPHGSGGRGGDVTTCGAALTSEEARLAGAGLFGGHGGAGGQMLRLPFRNQTGGDGGDAAAYSSCEGQAADPLHGTAGTDGSVCGDAGGGGADAVAGNGGPGPTGAPGEPTSPVGAPGCTGGRGGVGVGGKGGDAVKGCDNCPDGPGGKGGQGGDGGSGSGGAGGAGGTGGAGFSFPTGLCYDGGPGGVGGNGGLGKGGAASHAGKGGRPYGEGGDQSVGGGGSGHAGGRGAGGQGGEPGAGTDVTGAACKKGPVGALGALGTGAGGRAGRFGSEGDPCPQIDQ
jgi:hypothetical protein